MGEGAQSGTFEHKDGISSTYAQPRQRISNIYIYLYVSYQSVYTGSEKCITNMGKTDLLRHLFLSRTHWPIERIGCQQLG